MKGLTGGATFGDYRVVRRLGKGGMGEVWLLENATGGLLAAKILTGEADHEARKRFLREAELALSVKHPNLVEVFDVGEDPDTGLCYILMEYVPGGTLADVIKDVGALPIEDAVAVVQAIALVLELAREKGIVHRDIKPANIMFGADGTPKLADLGIARGGVGGTDTTTVTQTGMMIGTPAYMAPEQMLDAHSVDTRADIYSLGVVFFEMLTGQRPNKDDTIVQLMAKAVKGEPLPDVRTLRPEVSASLAQLLSMMVVPSVELRIAAPKLISSALDKIERGGTLAAPKPVKKVAPTPSVPKVEEKHFPWKVLIPFGILGFLAVAFVLLAPKQVMSPSGTAGVAVREVVRTNIVNSTLVKTNIVSRTVVETRIREVTGNPVGKNGNGRAPTGPAPVNAGKRPREEPDARYGDFKVDLLGVAVVDDIRAAWAPGGNFVPPSTLLDIPYGKVVAFDIAYDFPVGYKAHIWVRNCEDVDQQGKKVSFGSNPSGYYQGKGRARGFLLFHSRSDMYELKEIKVTTSTVPSLHTGAPANPVLGVFPVNVNFLPPTSNDLARIARQEKERKERANVLSGVPRESVRSMTGDASRQQWLAGEGLSRQLPPVRICYDQSHGGGINENGAFYLPLFADEKGFAHKPCWHGLADENLSRVNALVLPPSWNDIPYLPEERAAIRSFMEKGGTVFAIVDGNERNMAISKDLLAEYGATISARGVARDDEPCIRGKVLSPAFDDIRNVDFTPSAIVSAKSEKDASVWSALVVTEDGEPVLACRSVGKGHLVFASAGLHFSKDKMLAHPGTCRLWKRLFLSAANARRLSKNADLFPRDVLSAPCTMPVGPLTFHFAKRWEKEARRIGEYVKKSLPALKEMGVAEPQTEQVRFSNVALLGTGNMHWFWTGGKKHMVGIQWCGSPEHVGALVSEIVANMLNGSVRDPEGIPWRSYLAVRCLPRIGLKDEYELAIQSQWGDGTDARCCRAFDAIRNDCPNFPASFVANWAKAPKDSHPAEFFAILSKSIGRDCRPYFTKEGIVAVGLEIGDVAVDGQSAKLAFSGREIQKMKGMRGDKAVQKALDRLFPGWRVSACVGVADEGRNRIGYVPEIEGRRNVCCTLPKDVRNPVKLTKTVEVPAEGGALHFSVRKTPAGDAGFRMEIRVDGKTMNEYRIDDDDWVDETFDLSAWRGKKVRLEIRHCQLPELKNARALWSRLEVK